MIQMRNGRTADADYKRSFNELMQSVFGLNFEAWHARNMWGEEYECCSILEERKMLANASVMKMEMVIGGVKREHLQLGAVAVREEFRGKGLAARILTHIIDKYEDTPMFLSANDSVTGFYPKFGFKRIAYAEPWLDLAEQLGESGGLGSAASPGMRKLELNDPRVDRYVRERGQFSAVLDCLNPCGVNWFHLVYKHADHLYDVPELDLMLVAEQRDDVLELHDVIARRKVAFAELLPYLNFPGATSIRFGFNPDFLDVPCRWANLRHDPFFVRGDFPVKVPFVFPCLLVT